MVLGPGRFGTSRGGPPRLLTALRVREQAPRGLLPTPAHLLGGASVIRIHLGVSSELQKHLHGFQVAPEGRSVQWRPAEGALLDALTEHGPPGRGAGPSPRPAPTLLLRLAPCSASSWMARDCPPAAAVLEVHQGQAPLQPPRRPRRVAAHALAVQQRVHLLRAALSGAASSGPAAPPPTSRRIAWISPRFPSKAASSRRAPRCRSSCRRRFFPLPPGRLLLPPQQGHEGLRAAQSGHRPSPEPPAPVQTREPCSSRP